MMGIVIGEMEREGEGEQEVDGRLKRKTLLIKDLLMVY
jgi:hypothetical protein